MKNLIINLIIYIRSYCLFELKICFFVFSYSWFLWFLWNILLNIFFYALFCCNFLVVVGCNLWCLDCFCFNVVLCGILELEVLFCIFVVLMIFVTFSWRMLCLFFFEFSSMASYVSLIFFLIFNFGIECLSFLCVFLLWFLIFDRYFVVVVLDILLIFVLDMSDERDLVCVDVFIVGFGASF